MQVQDWLSANAEEGIIIEERTSKESQIPLPAEFLEEGIDGDDAAVVLSLVKDRQEYIIFADIMLKDLFRQYRVENWNAVLSVLRKILSEAGMLRRKVKTLDECRKQLPAELLPLFDELRRVRAKKSRETGMPAYAVASNVSLEMICRELPDSMESLRKIKGMGRTVLSAARSSFPALRSIRTEPAAKKPAAAKLRDDIHGGARRFFSHFYAMSARLAFLHRLFKTY